MDTFKFKKEQERLAKRLSIKDSFEKISTVGGVACIKKEDKLIASIIVLYFPSLELKEKQSFILSDPLNLPQEFQSYVQLPAIIEACNKLEQDPDLLLVLGDGINHPRKLGLASHVGLATNIPTIAVTQKKYCGEEKDNKILINGEFRGYTLKTNPHANPLYVAPGNNISLSTTKKLFSQLIKLPHKLPEPLHLAQKRAKKKLEK